MRRPMARRSRGRGPAGPGTKAGARSGSRPACITSASDPRASRIAADPSTATEVLVGSTSWLLSLRDWLVEELDLADGETVQLCRTDVERMAGSLARCAACLDTLAADPAQLLPLDDASPGAAPFSANSGLRTLQ